MNINRLAWPISFTLTLCVMGAAVALGEQPAADAAPAAAQAAAGERMSVVAARERAKLMHEIYAATLEVMHERYFRDERAIVPARAMEDVFQEIERTSNIRARWISVNMEPMSVNHAPKGEFEKSAAREMAGGKSDVEAVEEGYYRRAGAIELESSCVQCHLGFFKELPKTPRYVGLVISIPVAEEK